MLVDSLEYGITRIEPRQVLTFNYKLSDKFQKQWIAKITGICNQFGFKREFLKDEKFSYSDVRLQGHKYELEPCRIYQYRNLLVNTESEKFIEGYFAVTYLQVIELEKEQIRSYLRMPVKGWLKDQGSIKPKANSFKFADDNIKF
jgi:hypothetical protein